MVAGPGMPPVAWAAASKAEMEDMAVAGLELAGGMSSPAARAASMREEAGRAGRSSGANSS